MSKITLSEPYGPYRAVLDAEVMDVVIEKVFKGITFVTPDKEELTVCMRDSGFELVYQENTVIELKGGELVIGGKNVPIIPKE